MMELSNGLYNLNMLYEQVGKDDVLLKKFVEIFLNSVPADVILLDKAIKEADLTAAGAIAHKLKSSFLLMGAEWAKDICVVIETNAKRGIETEKLPEKIKELLDNFLKMVSLLQSDFILP